MKPDWKIDSSICTAGCTVKRIAHTSQDESIYRRLTGGNARWASRHHPLGSACGQTPRQCPSTTTICQLRSWILVPRICHMGKTAARARIVPMALVAFEQYFPKAQVVIDDALAADRRRLASTPVERMVYAERGDCKYHLRRGPNADRSRRWSGEKNPFNIRSCR